MNKRTPLLIAPLLSLLPLTAGAILLDCEVTGEHLYRCIEVGKSAADAAEKNTTQAYDSDYDRYVEAAKKDCVYKPPAYRPGKSAGVALKSEQLKSAQEDYDNCVADKARALWLEHRSAPAGH